MDGGMIFARQEIYLRFYGPNVGPARRVSDRWVNDLDIPSTAWGFCFYDVFTAQLVNPAESKKVIILKSSEENFSPVHYIGGELFTIEDGERVFGAHESVIRYTPDPMDDEWTIFDEVREGKHPTATHVIECRDGNVRLFNEKLNIIVPTKVATGT